MYLVGTNGLALMYGGCVKLVPPRRALFFRLVLSLTASYCCLSATGTVGGSLPGQWPTMTVPSAARQRYTSSLVRPVSEDTLVVNLEGAAGGHGHLPSPGRRHGQAGLAVREVDLGRAGNRGLRVGRALVHVARQLAVVHVELRDQAVARVQHAAPQRRRVVGRHADAARVGVLPQQAQHLHELVGPLAVVLRGAASVRRAAVPPVEAVHAADVADVVVPQPAAVQEVAARVALPDLDALVRQRLGVGLAAAEPQQLFDHRLGRHELAGDQRELRPDVEAQLAPEDAACAGPGAVATRRAGVPNVDQQVAVRVLLVAAVDARVSQVLVAAARHGVDQTEAPERVGREKGVALGVAEHVGRVNGVHEGREVSVDALAARNEDAPAAVQCVVHAVDGAELHGRGVLARRAGHDDDRAAWQAADRQRLERDPPHDHDVAVGQRPEAPQVVRDVPRQSAAVADTEAVGEGDDGFHALFRAV